MPGILELVLKEDRILEDESFGEIIKKTVRLSHIKLPKMKTEDEFRLVRTDLDEAYSCAEASIEDKEKGMEFSKNQYDGKSMKIPFKFKSWVKFTVDNNRNLGAFHRFLRGRFYFRPYGKRGAGKLILELDQIMGFMDVVAFDEEYIKRRVDFFPCSFNIALAGFVEIFKCKPYRVHSEFKLEILEGDDLEQGKEKLRKFATKIIFNLNNDFEISSVRYDLSRGFVKHSILKESYSLEIKHFEIVQNFLAIPKLLNKEALGFMVNAVFNTDFELYSQLDIIRTENAMRGHFLKYKIAALIAVAALQALGERGSFLLQRAIIFASRTYRFNYSLRGGIPTLQFRGIGQDLLNKLFDRIMEKVEVKYDDFYMEGELKIFEDLIKGFFILGAYMSLLI